MNKHISSRRDGIAATDRLLRALLLDDEAYGRLVSDMDGKGYACFRWGGFPPWERNLPKRGDEVAFVHERDTDALIYMMRCVAVGDDDARDFVEDKESLNADDDCCYYVFTGIGKPVAVERDKTEFLHKEKLCTHQPETYLSEEASAELMALTGNI